MVTFGQQIADRAIQVRGAGGMTDDFPLAHLYVSAWALAIADGPDEVHKRTPALTEPRRHDPSFGRPGHQCPAPGQSA